MHRLRARHYKESLALPFPIATNLTPVQIAIFSEQCTTTMGVDLEVRSTRFYPFTNTAAHGAGSLQHDDSRPKAKTPHFFIRLPDYRGLVGIEFGYDKKNCAAGPA